MPTTTVAAILWNEDATKLVLTRRDHPPFTGYWCLPGGHIEQDEPARDAAVREAREETGLEFSPAFQFYQDEIIPDAGVHHVVLVYAGAATGTLRAQPGEVSEIGWFTPVEALALKLAFRHGEILSQYLRSTGNGTMWNVDSCNMEADGVTLDRTAGDAVTLLRRLFDEQRFGVLATCSSGPDAEPFTSLMAFADADQLTALFLATRRATRKYRHLMENPAAALLVDNRSNRGSDTAEALAVTASGVVTELTGTARAGAERIFAARHPYMAEFVRSPDCALLCLHVEVYQIVRGIDDVREWHPG